MSCVRLTYEQPCIVLGALWLVDKGVSFDTAVVLSSLLHSHNSWHGLYCKSESHYGEEKIDPTRNCALNWWGYTENKEYYKWNNKEYYRRGYRQGKNTDINMIIRAAVKTYKFVRRTDIPSISENRYIHPVQMQWEILNTPVDDDEWQYGFDYGDFDKLINLNPVERIKMK